MELRWDLTKIYSSFHCPELIQDKVNLFQLLEKKATCYLNYFTSDAPTTEKLIEYITTMNQSNQMMLKLTAFARLHLAIDSSDMEAKSLLDEVEQNMSKLHIMNREFLYFLQELDDISQYTKDNPLLSEHADILEDLKNQSSHLLDQTTEDLISELASTGSYAYSKLHEEITTSLLVDVTIGDEPSSIPLSVARNMAYAQSGELRKAAYTAELKAYKSIRTTAAACLNGIKGEAITIAKARGFSSPLAMTLLDSRMNEKTLDTMFQAIIDALPHFHAYLKAKAHLLGHDGSLPFYDLYAPIGAFSTKYTYEDAKSIIVTAFGEFSKNLGEFALRAFEHGWIDMEPREGKISGTFCCNLHAIGESRIMANFSGTFYDVTTLAHELGHAYHGEMLKNVSVLNNDYTMPLAESASIFCETLVTNHILKTATDQERFAILEHNSLNYTQICVEILCRYTFENSVFTRRKSGPLSVEELNNLMLDAQRFAYGDGLTDELHESMWICKPHYYFPDFHFYNFPYPYGLLFSKGLYALYEKEGPAFATTFQHVLQATGSKPVADIFHLLHVTSDSPVFYQDALKLVTNQIDDFITLVDKKK